MGAADQGHGKETVKLTEAHRNVLRATLKLSQTRRQIHCKFPHACSIRIF